jgi:hypothetical protein
LAITTNSACCRRASAASVGKGGQQTHVSNFFIIIIKNIINMKFEEIFKENGMYMSDSFVEGFCFEIFGTTKTLIGVQYKSKDDIMPSKDNFPCYEGLFKKTYKKVFTVSQLFKS